MERGGQIYEEEEEKLEALRKYHGWSSLSNAHVCRHCVRIVSENDYRRTIVVFQRITGGRLLSFTATQQYHNDNLPRRKQLNGTDNHTAVFLISTGTFFLLCTLSQKERISDARSLSLSLSLSKKLKKQKLES